MAEWQFALLFAFGLAAILWALSQQQRKPPPAQLIAYLREAERLGWPGRSGAPAGPAIMQAALNMIHRPVITDDDRTTKEAVAHVASMWVVSERMAKHYGMAEGDPTARIAIRIVATMKAFSQGNYGLPPTPADWALCAAAPIASGKAEMEQIAKCLDLIDLAVTTAPETSSAQRL